MQILFFPMTRWRRTAVLLAGMLALAGFAAAATPAGGEDLTTPSLTAGQLAPASPELIDRSEEEHFTSEWITVHWRADDPIYLFVVLPTRIKRPPVVLYLYDYPAETDIFRDDDWCARVTAGGYAAVGFVPALNGHRYHDRPMKEWFVSELQEALAKSAHDVQMTLTYLAGRGDIDTDRAAIFGVGSGAAIAVAAASADTRIRVVDVVNPWGDWQEWLSRSPVVPEEERAAFVRPEFLRPLAAFDPAVLLPKLAARVRLSQSPVSSTPKEAAAKIRAALPRGAEFHAFTDEAEFDALAAGRGQGLEWAKAQLRGAPAGRTGGSANRAGAK